MPSTNYLRSNSATLNIHGLSDFNYQLTTYNIPGLSTNPAMINTPFGEMAFTGDTLRFEELEVTFNVDETMSNWLAVYKWMFRNSPPDAFLDEENDEKYSDATLIIYDPMDRPMINMTLYSCLPTSLSSIEFTEEDAETVYKKANASFKYQYYDFEIL